MSNDTGTKLLELNKIAMELLRKNRFGPALNYLKQAENVLIVNPKLGEFYKFYSITLNNLGCFYKRTGHFKLALRYLKCCLEVETPSPSPLNLAGTHLNICAIQSQLGHHEKALMHASQAISLTKSAPQKTQSLITTLIIAYHNAGLEYEALSHRHDAVQSFRKALELSKKHLGLSSSLTASLKKCLARYGESSNEAIHRTKKRSSISPRIYKRDHKRRSVNTTFHSQTPRWKFSREPVFPKIEMSVSNDYFKKKFSSITQSKFTSSKTSSERKKVSFRSTAYDGYSEFSTQSCRAPSIGVQTELGTNIRKTLKEHAAVIIQKNWRRFRDMKKFQLMKYNLKIKHAELKAQNAIAELEELRSQRQRITAKLNVKFPVPIKTKLEKYSLKPIQESPRSKRVT